MNDSKIISTNGIITLVNKSKYDISKTEFVSMKLHTIEDVVVVLL
jgi:hypothetical protein